MKSTLKILILSSLTLLMAFSCGKEKWIQEEQIERQEQHFPYVTYKAQGTIIDIFNNGCDGDLTMIEVSDPKNIGNSGVTYTSKGKIEYENAIAVPLFSKLRLPENIPDTIGTWLYFEYRDLEKGEYRLFQHIPAELCHPAYVSPPATRYILTRVIDYH